MYQRELGTEIQNTACMDLRPEPAEAVHLLDCEAGKAVELRLSVSGQQFQRLVDYPVLVELWRRKDHGRVRRQWVQDFTQAERNKIGRYYGRFYRWHLVTGTPERVICRPETLRLLQRAVDWFASNA